MILLQTFWESLVGTIRDILPIVVIIGFFQLAVLRRPFTNLPRLAWGFGFVIVGLTLFLMGLELALFPLGESMAAQLMELQDLGSVAESTVAESTDAGSTVAGPSTDELAIASESATEIASANPWYNYYWTYLFAFVIGVSTTIAEPALIAVALKAQEVSGGAIQSLGLRLAVALGVGIGVAMGTFRIVVGIPLPYFILPGYVLVVIQTYFAPKSIIPLAYDSGGVTTSTVTVPLVAALGLGLASRVPGRDPVIDGFGLIAFASLFPMMTVMGYAQLAEWKASRRKRLSTQGNTEISDAL